jgi:hypothetical protein
MVKREVLVLGCMLIISALAVSVFAASSDFDTATASVIINQFISVTLTSGSPIDFGNMDPGQSLKNATNNPLNITIGSETNVDFTISTKANSTTFKSGSNTFAVGNLNWNDDSFATKTNYTTSDVAVYSTQTSPREYSIYHELAIPTPQKAGDYNVGVIITAAAV